MESKNPVRGTAVLPGADLPGAPEWRWYGQAGAAPPRSRGRCAPRFLERAGPAMSLRWNSVRSVGGGPPNRSAGTVRPRPPAAARRTARNQGNGTKMWPRRGALPDFTEMFTALPEGGSGRCQKQSRCVGWGNPSHASPIDFDQCAKITFCVLCNASPSDVRRVLKVRPRRLPPSTPELGKCGLHHRPFL
jgi:hypothetical protein